MTLNVLAETNVIKQHKTKTKSNLYQACNPFSFFAIHQHVCGTKTNQFERGHRYQNPPPSLNRDGGRYNLPPVWDNIEESSLNHSVMHCWCSPFDCSNFCYLPSNSLGHRFVSDLFTISHLYLIYLSARIWSVFLWRQIPSVGLTKCSSLSPPY